MKEVFLMVLNLSPIQIVYETRSIPSPRRILPGRAYDPCYVGVECVSGLTHCAGRRTILLRMPQQVASRW
jgi:hypothetical protein